MNVKELRVGNYAKNIFGIIRIEEIPLKSNSLYNPDAIDPLPLTEEILLRCNFILFDGRYKFSDNEWFSVSIEGVWCSLYCNGMYYAVDFKYVHQLQNLYFALTGNELEITL